MTDPRHTDLRNTDLRNNDHNQEPGYEERDLGSRPVYGFLVALVITGVVVYFTVWGIFFGLEKFFNKHQDAMSPMAHVATTPPRMVPPSIWKRPFLSRAWKPMSAARSMISGWPKSRGLTATTGLTRPMVW